MHDIVYLKSREGQSMTISNQLILSVKMKFKQYFENMNETESFKLKKFTGILQLSKSFQGENS